jgi:hypothetical protein
MLQLEQHAAKQQEGDCCTTAASLPHAVLLKVMRCLVAGLARASSYHCWLAGACCWLQAQTARAGQRGLLLLLCMVLLVRVSNVPGCSQLPERLQPSVASIEGQLRRSCDRTAPMAGEVVVALANSGSPDAQTGGWPEASLMP